MIYIVYRNKESKKILSYSVYQKEPISIDEAINKYNETSDKYAERVSSDDIISMIEIAEDKKKLKQADLNSIESAIENLQSEFYNLRESFNV